MFTRALADELQKVWHQPVVVENRPGGGQNIGARACAESPPDGYTICVLSSEPAAYNEFLYKSIPYNPEKDFQPIANLFFNTLAVVINGETKVKSFAGMIAMAKETPGKLSYATFSFPASYFMDKLNKAEHVDIVRVPYKGGGEVVNAVLGGNTPIAVLALSNMVSLLQSGRITPLAVVSNSRSPLFPDVPTLEEVRPASDFPPTWFGLFTQTACRGRSSRRFPPTSTASWPIRDSASACTSIAASSRRRSGLTHSRASSAASASSPAASSRNPAGSRNRSSAAGFAGAVLQDRSPPGSDRTSARRAI